MKNKQKFLITGILMFSIILTINLISAQDDNETVIIGTREFTRYGDILVESSVLNALTVENQAKIRVVIEINESLDEDVDTIKTGILSNLTGNEFKLTHNLKDRNWFSGDLTKEGLEKLKIENGVVKITESRGGELGQEENTTEKSPPKETNGEGEEFEPPKERINLLWLWTTIIIAIILIMIVFFIIKRKV